MLNPRKMDKIMEERTEMGLLVNRYIHEIYKAYKAGPSDVDSLSNNCKAYASLLNNLIPTPIRNPSLDGMNDNDYKILREASRK